MGCANKKQKGLAVASIARDDTSPLPGMHRDHNAPACTATRLAVRTHMHAVNLDRNLKPKLAIMRQCTSVTDRRTDRRTLDIVAQARDVHCESKNWATCILTVTL